jgi:hypothetical protein
MRKGIVLGSIAVLGLASQAYAADGFSYSFIEAGYISTDLDDETLGFDVDGDGFALRGSVGFTDLLHGYVDYTNQDYDFGVSIDTWEVGIGASHSLNPNADLVGRLGYAKFDAGVLDENGFALQAGVRGRVTDRFEVEGLVHYVDYGDEIDGTSFIANGRYFFTDEFAAGIGAELGNDATIWNVSLRYNFNNE